MNDNLLDKESISNFLTSFSDSIGKENVELYQNLNKESHILDVTDYEEFFFGVLYPFKKYISGLITSEISDNKDVIFILENSQFIEGHFQKMIKTYEDWPCCADKSRTIMKALLNYYKNDEEIVFNYDQQYTYHLPKILFKTHDQIIEFYEGVKGLYFGSLEKYLQAFVNVKNIVNEFDHLN
jgi:hypothetical protein